MPRPGRVMADYDLVIARSPTGAGQRRIQGVESGHAAGQVAAARRRLIGIHSHGKDPASRSSTRSGRRRPVQDRPLCDPAPGQARTRQRGAALQFQCLVRRAFDLPLSHAYAAGRGQRPDRTSTLFAAGMPRSMSRRSRTSGSRSGPRRPLPRAPTGPEKIWRAVVQRRDLCDFTPPRLGMIAAPHAPGSRHGRFRSDAARRRVPATGE